MHESVDHNPATSDLAQVPRRNILIGVTGCIAAYKACYIARSLVAHGFSVKTVMTEAATRFVGPATFRALTGNPVITSMWEDTPSAPVHHIALAQETDVFLIAPCTANVIAKLASGRADDMLTTTALATQAPIIVAPAMNTAMWNSEVTQANVSALRQRGVIVVDPGCGELACGDSGQGRLADVEDIIESVLVEAHRTRSLAGAHILITAGPTREPIDPVRFISNHSSGLTGYAIAEEASRRGARVTLISGPTSLPVPFGVDFVGVMTAREMHAAAIAAFEDCDVVIATAAVSDHRPATLSAVKLKKTDELANIPLAPNPDILADLAKVKGHRLVIGFAAETNDVISNAKAKLKAKNLDLVVANDVSDPSIGFATLHNRVSFVGPLGIEQLDTQSKKSIARRLLDLVSDRLAPTAETKEQS